MSNELHQSAIILDSLASRGVRVEAIGDRILLTPRGIAEPAELDALRANRAEVLAELRRRANPIPTHGNLDPSGVAIAGQAGTGSGDGENTSSAEVSAAAPVVGEPTVNWFDAMCAGLANVLHPAGRLVTRPDGRRAWMHPNEREAGR